MENLNYNTKHTNICIIYNYLYMSLILKTNKTLCYTNYLKAKCWHIDQFIKAHFLCFFFQLFAGQSTGRRGLGPPLRDLGLHWLQ